MNIEELFTKAKAQLSATLPFVLYRKPLSSETIGFFQKDDALHTAFQFTVSGFVFSPFDHKQPSILFPLQDCQRFSAEVVYTMNPDDVSVKSEKDSDPIASKEHKQLIRLAVDTIENSTLKKIVLSREEVIQNVEENPIELFSRLLNSYPDAFVYIWYHPKIGTWLGATPETLLQIKGEALFTMSLAGTQPYVGNIDVPWGDKEIEEQELVTDFILQALNGKVKNIVKSDVQTHKAGTLLHLKTAIRASLDPESAEITSIIRALHPTPAVCGLPRDMAKTFISDHEKLDRAYYTGFLGEINMENTGVDTLHLFVNLRCMKIEKKSAILFVGGGITKDSDPEKEWEETMRKTATMKKVLS